MEGFERMDMFFEQHGLKDTWDSAKDSLTRRLLKATQIGKKEII